MKFELKAANQRIPDGDLLADLRRVADLIGSATLVKSAYDTHGRFYRGTIASRFGSWQDALRRAGLEPQSVTTPKELLSDLQRVARELNRNYLPFKEYRRLGKWSERPFVRVFEDWQTALSTAGLDQHPNLKQRATMEDLFSNLEAVWIAIGRQPTYAEMVRPLSKFGATTYAKHFGGWRSALERFIEWVNSPDSEEPRPAAEQLGESPATPKPAAPVLPVRRSRRTPRTANLRLRFIVMHRDRFSCQHCGRSPALHPGLVLHIDHIVPWEKGGETDLANLQTLCEDCNLGKCNLCELRPNALKLTRSLGH